MMTCCFHGGRKEGEAGGNTAFVDADEKGPWELAVRPHPTLSCADTRLQPRASNSRSNRAIAVTRASRAR